MPDDSIRGVWLG